MVLITDAHGELPPRSADGHWVLETSRDWTLTGEAGELDAVAAALFHLRARRVHDLVLLVSPGNGLGRLDVPHLGVVELVTGKWTEQDFDRTLEDLISRCAGLPWSSGGGPGLAPEWDGQNQSVAYHGFLYLRHVLSDAVPLDQQLIPALRAILRYPHRRMVSEDRRVPPWAASRMTASQLVDVLAAPGWERAGRAARALPAMLRGYLPVEVAETVVRPTFDTAENRFVLSFLRRCNAIIEAVRAALESDAVNVFQRRVRADCRRMVELLDPVSRHRLWDDVGTLVHFPAGSSVLQGRHGYREVLGHHVRLSASCRLPTTTMQAHALLELKDGATLYELWTFFAVVDAVSEVVGTKPKLDAPKVTAWQTSIPWQFRASWSDVAVFYNRTYARGASERHSWSVQLRPDITIVLANGDVHVMDAKWKYEGEADIPKMHAYRDAITSARSAWVLYPSGKFTGYLEGGEALDPADLMQGAAVAGVGAVPCTPEDTGVIGKLITAVLGGPSQHSEGSGS